MFDLNVLDNFSARKKSELRQILSKRSTIPVRKTTFSKWKLQLFVGIWTDVGESTIALPDTLRWPPTVLQFHYYSSWIFFIELNAFVLTWKDRLELFKRILKDIPLSYLSRTLVLEFFESSKSWASTAAEHDQPRRNCNAMNYKQVSKNFNHS